MRKFHKQMCRELLVQQFLTLKCFCQGFPQKLSFTFVGNEGIYSVGSKSVYQIVQSGRTESFASVSCEVLTCELLAKHSCLHLYWLFAFQSCARPMLPSRDAQSRDTSENHPGFNCLSLHTLSHYHTTFTINFHNKYRVNKIE